MITDNVLSLRLNIDELTNTHLQTAETAYSIDGQAIIENNSGMVPGLIAQLRQSSQGGIGGGGSSPQNTRSPIAVGIWNLLHEIGSTTSDNYQRITRQRAQKSTEHNLQAWANAAQQWPHEVEKLLKVTDKWINQIDELLNPPRRWELAHPCPNCGERWVIRESEDGPAKSAALIVSKKQAECRACEATWMPTEFHQLAEAMGVGA